MPWIKSCDGRLVNLAEVVSVNYCAITSETPNINSAGTVYAVTYPGRYDLFRGTAEECGAYMSRLFAFLGGRVV